MSPSTHSRRRGRGAGCNSRRLPQPRITSETERGRTGSRRDSPPTHRSQLLFRQAAEVVGDGSGGGGGGGGVGDGVPAEAVADGVDGAVGLEAGEATARAGAGAV